MTDLPSIADLKAELARRGPVLDDSPETLERVVEVLIEARALPRGMAEFLRRQGIEVSEEAVLDG